MPSTAQLRTISTALDALTSVHTGNDSEEGYWRRIALALEEAAGASVTRNENLHGYMERAAIAAEALWGGSGAEENLNQAGLLKRIVDAMELDAGVGSGSLENRLLAAAGLVETMTVTTWNPADKGSQIVLSNGDLSATNNAATFAWHIARGTNSYDEGIHSWEAEPTFVGGGSGMMVGFANGTESVTTALGFSTHSVGYSSTGAVHVNGVTVATLATYTLGDVITCVIDIDAGTVTFAKNGGASSAAISVPGLIGDGIFPATSILESATVTGDFAAWDAAPVPVIFYSDLAPDVDDLLAVAVLGDLVLSGQADVIAAGVSTRNPKSAHAMRVLLDHMGKMEVPVGAYQGSLATLADSSGYASAIADLGGPATLRAGYPDIVDVFRSALAASAGGVRFIVVGSSTGLDELLLSAGDGASPLGGSDLVAAKVHKLYPMAGKFAGGGTEFNVEIDVTAANYVATNWPTPIDWSGSEIAGGALTEIDNHLTYWPEEPYRRGWEVFGVVSRASWDSAAVLEAVRGEADGHWTHSALGDVSFHPTTFETTFTPNPAGKSRHLIRTATSDAALAATLQARINGYMAQKGIIEPASNSSLVARYTFEEGSGQVVTDSVNGLNGTLGETSGADGGEPTWVASGINVASTKGVRIPANAAFDASTRFAAVALIRPSNITGNTMIFARMNEEQPNHFWNIYNSNGKIRLGHRKDEFFNAKETGVVLANNTWSMVTFVMENHFLAVRHNGVQQLIHYTDGLGINVGTGQDFFIGAGYNYGWEAPFRGDIRYAVYALNNNASDLLDIEDDTRTFATSKGITIP